jgi:hypothetical protein
MERDAVDRITYIRDYSSIDTITSITYTRYITMAKASSVTEKQISLHLPEALLQEIDTFGFESRIRSRNEVIRRLLREALDAHHGRESSTASASSTERART